MPQPLLIAAAFHAGIIPPRSIAEPYIAICNIDESGHRPPGYSTYDDVYGFSRNNYTYCELSPFRVLTSTLSDQAERVGLVHYRRVFLSNSTGLARGALPGVFTLPSWDWAELPYSATSQELLRAIGDADWVTPTACDVRRLGYSSLATQLARTTDRHLVEVLIQATERNNPDLYPFRTYLENERYLYPFNMLIANSSLARQYADFLWPILADAILEIGKPTNGYLRRYAGFMAERLHGYWLEHGAQRRLRTSTLPVGMVANERLDSPALSMARRLLPHLPVGVESGARRAARFAVRHRPRFTSSSND